MLDDKYLIWEGGYIIRVVYTNDLPGEAIKDISSPTLQAVEETLELLKLFTDENKINYHEDKLVDWFLNVESNVFAQKNKPQDKEAILQFMTSLFDSWFDSTPENFKVEIIDVLYSQYPIYVERLKQYEYPKYGTNHAG